MKRKQKEKVIVKIRFYGSDEGGRRSSLPVNEFRCPMIINDQFYDCLIGLPKGDRIKPGDTILTPVEFLSPDLVIPMLKIGKKVNLWEGGIIAEGEVIEIEDEK